MSRTQKKIKPVFIIGASRSGSKIYMNLFNLHTQVDIITEAHILNPFWLHPDFQRSTNKKIKCLSTDENVDELIKLMYSSFYFGTFWIRLRLDKESMRRRIIESDRSIAGIFSAIMEESRVSNGKSIPGAKYPVHFSYVPTLLKWFPESKIIHIVRDPRAFFSSQLFKHAKERTIKHKIKRLLFYLPVLVHSIIQFTWSASVYQKHKHLDNYYLSRYEDLVSNPNDRIKEIFAFIGIPFSEDCLEIPVADSSYDIKVNRISRASLESWKNNVPIFFSKIIRIFCQRGMAILQYR